MNRPTSARRGVRRNLSASSNGSASGGEPSLLPRRNTYRKRGSKRPPKAASSKWLYLAMSAGIIFVLLDVAFLVRYVLRSHPELVKDLPIPELIRKDEEDADDGINPEGDGDDHVEREPKNLFANPVKEPIPATAEKKPDARVAGLDDDLDHPDEAVAETDDKTPDEKIKEQADNVKMDAADGAEDKERILELLRDAEVPITDEIIAKLPTWSEVSALYGDKPVVYGLEQCERFRNEVTDPAEHFLSTAGAFNTGTNLFAELLIHNCHMPARMKKYGAKNRGIRWQVLWGKHTPVGDEDFRVNHKTYQEESLKAENIFAAVTVRDPFKWMQSMCRHQYGAYWRHNSTHCPNLLPNEQDLSVFPMLTENQPVPVHVKYKEFTKHHDSLVGFWNDWYNEYVHAPFPRLIVRFEDAIFHPKELTRIACECAGGELNKTPFRYEVESAKKGTAHGKEKTTYVDALIKYGTEKGRYKGYEEADLEYARENLDPHLLEIFGYKLPPSSAVAGA